jgi:hypothetical protein
VYMNTNKMRILNMNTTPEHPEFLISQVNQEQNF